jgi:hypothetical protein
LRITVLIALVLSAAMLTGCEASIGGENSKDALERIINEQLPQKISAAGQGTIKVTSVNCVEQTKDKFDCVAAVEGEDSEGKPVKQDLKIEGSCDKEECIWKTVQ